MHKCPEGFDIDRSTLHYKVNDTDPASNGGLNAKPFTREGAPEPRFYDDFDPFCGLLHWATGTRAKVHATVQFGRELSSRCRPDTLLFIREMFSRLLVETDRPVIFRANLRTSANFEKTAGNCPSEARRDETWFALPKAESTPFYPKSSKHLALEHLDDWLLFFAAKHFYGMLNGSGSGNGLLQAATSPMGNNEIGVRLHDDLTPARNALDWRASAQFKNGSLPEARRKALEESARGKAIADDLRERLMHDMLNGRESLTVDLPNLFDMLPAMEKVACFDAASMPEAWVDRVRKPEDKARAMMLTHVRNRVLEWA